MLTKTFDYYAIHTTDSERSSSDKAFFDTLEEAFNERMNYANWWQPNGNVYIIHYRLHDNKNEVIDEFNFFEDNYGASYRNGKYLNWPFEEIPVKEFLKREGSKND